MQRPGAWGGLSARTVAVGILAAAALAACQQPTDEASSGPAQASSASSAVPQVELASLGAEATPEVRALYEGDFQAFGGLNDVGAGEGAWELQLSDGFAQFVRPGLQDFVAYQVERGYFEAGMRVSAGPLTITLQRGACPIPSGEAMEYTASIVFEGVVYSGCARRGIADGGMSAGWAVAIEELAPAIEACLARGGEPPIVVTTASMLPSDGENQPTVSVRMRDSNRLRRECVATPDGGSIVAVDAVADSDTRLGEDDPSFVPASQGEPRARSCREVSAVSTESGRMLGWLVRRTC